MLIVSFLACTMDIIFKALSILAVINTVNKSCFDNLVSLVFPKTIQDKVDFL